MGAVASMHVEVVVCMRLEGTGCVLGTDAACQERRRGGSRATHTCEEEQRGVWGEGVDFVRAIQVIFCTPEDDTQENDG